MTEEVHDGIKNLFLTAGVLIFLAILICVLAFLIKPDYEEKLKKNVEEILHASQKETMTLSANPQYKKTSFSTLSAWSVTEKKHKDKIVFVLTITGDSGPYTGIFLVSQSTGTQFCGLLGLPQSIENSKQFGITERILTYRIKMIETIAKREGFLQ